MDKGLRPGFRNRGIKCIFCGSNDFSPIYRDRLQLLYCHECHCVWTVHIVIEDVVDKECRV